MKHRCARTTCAISLGHFSKAQGQSCEVSTDIPIYWSRRPRLLLQGQTSRSVMVVVDYKADVSSCSSRLPKANTARQITTQAKVHHLPFVICVILNVTTSSLLGHFALRQARETACMAACAVLEATADSLLRFPGTVQKET